MTPAELQRLRAQAQEVKALATGASGGVVIPPPVAYHLAHEFMMLLDDAQRADAEGYTRAVADVVAMIDDMATPNCPGCDGESLAYPLNDTCDECGGLGHDVKIYADRERIIERIEHGAHVGAAGER